MANGHGGVRPNSGGKRPGAGRKPKSREDELISLLDECWTLDQRRDAVRVMASWAQSGSTRHFGMLMAYAYGTPPSGDELRIQEAVDAEFDNLTKTLEKVLSPDAWREVQQALGLD